jgi:hypothetical protein
MRALPAAITAVSVADRLASHAVYVGAAPWIVAFGSLRCEHIAHAIGLAGRASTVGARHLRVAYGRGCEALRAAESAPDRERCGAYDWAPSALP